MTDMELKTYIAPTPDGTGLADYYLKSEADKVIADKDKEIAQLQAMLEERNKQVGELKDRIAPKQANKTLQERLNEVCEKHGVSTLQDLDWAFCESEKRRTRDNIEAAKEIVQLQAMLEKRNGQIAKLIEKNEWLANKDMIMASETIKDVLKQLRRHKYKRCLDMAELCRAKRNEIIARTPTLILNHPTEYLTRWENRWLELAEKFKEAK